MTCKREIRRFLRPEVLGKIEKFRITAGRVPDFAKPRPMKSTCYEIRSSGRVPDLTSESIINPKSAFPLEGKRITDYALGWEEVEVWK